MKPLFQGHKYDFYLNSKAWYVCLYDQINDTKVQLPQTPLSCVPNAQTLEWCQSQCGQRVNKFISQKSQSSFELLFITCVFVTTPINSIGYCKTYLRQKGTITYWSPNISQKISWNMARRCLRPTVLSDYLKPINLAEFLSVQNSRR